MTTTIDKARADIVRFGALLFERHLTDAAGGNISVRVGDKICISPRYSGQKRQWQLQPEDVLLLDEDGNILEGEGQISRESQVHLKLHRHFKEYGTAVIHCHARNVLVFAAANKSMPPILEANLKFGEIPIVAYAPAHTAQLSQNILGAMIGHEARVRKHAAAAIAPWHGLFVMGKDLDAAFDAAERIDTNAYCILMGRQLGMDVEATYQLLESEAARWGKE
ncbi:MAG: class II aldolase/adducin family protein [Anaerolineae bacterium]|nr:class II aldolase/adducin family protein [Anaerolineae bacterium]MDW8173167.1 class II aldolase/adducin family protein [Anaerolineae bacterium]